MRSRGTDFRRGDARRAHRFPDGGAAEPAGGVRSPTSIAPPRWRWYTAITGLPYSTVQEATKFDVDAAVNRRFVLHRQHRDRRRVFHGDRPMFCTAWRCRPDRACWSSAPAGAHLAVAGAARPSCHSGGCRAVFLRADLPPRRGRRCRHRRHQRRVLSCRGRGEVSSMRCCSMIASIIATTICGCCGR